MNVNNSFLPSRQKGLIFQIGLSLALLAAAGVCVFAALAANLGLTFIALILVALVLFAPTPLLIYRLYGLLTARYTLERDGLRIRWGLRSEDIPLPEIEWMRMAVDLPTFSLPALPMRPRGMPLPWLRWPGALIGSRQVEGLGRVEYIASDPATLLLVATPGQIFAISPADPQGFMRTFNQITELGSLAPLTPRSLYPTFLLARIYADRLARALLLAGLGLGLVLLVWVGLAVPTRETISLGFSPTGAHLDPGPAETLLLLPVLFGLSYLTVFLAGTFFYRRSDQKLLAYILWSANILEGLLLSGALLAITG